MSAKETAMWNNKAVKKGRKTKKTAWIGGFSKENGRSVIKGSVKIQ